MSIKTFLQEIDQGLTSPAYLLYAANEYMIEEALSAVKRTIPETELPFNFNVFDMDSADSIPTAVEIIDNLNTISFFGSRRYVVVRNLQKISAKEFKKFQSYAANPSPNSVFLMSYAGALKKEMKESAKGLKPICLDMRASDMPIWIKEKLRQKGITIKDDAVGYLIGVVGDDIGLLSAEIEKLASIGNETITISAIKEIVEGSRDYSVFDLTNALREKNVEKVFRIYRTLAETTEPYSLLGAINWHYCKMSMQAAPSRSGQRKDFSRAFELLNNADIQIKTSGGAYPIEHLLVRLLQL
ncbi:MAG: DNA polymerase III subunit delta [Nitrospirae bacterium CG_4_10_14_3_um_filter_44_29]|nr:DNA polymerase III subunit delta [Nitrospirota bacterium]OIO27802.1 MAG: DNA polymerase III subunit delta [Nitrospirae bacterium CG1_02_44_142]PIP70332.1 MAG: DNA polymerase III subunit delta [Nitrospirae bacterium CG22_combo_CG10-13_8_21_14_all_44_11]PIV40036.1 MAG: DNA polymerase III subunit delta [Nitrospirae bacterium CG02_land_8_20_14_3_00_44_33]PIV67327.1 MAG: DNA polymerase III subunit delta [Nitrospirae bacterium CG01_land_8_20_14_3_00_44_22]PIW90253.1 MAG: DNA polymerase III subuni